MQSASDEPHRDLIYAQAPDGCRLPVIDLSNPRFAVADDPASVRQLHESLDAWERKQRFTPPELNRVFLEFAAKRSPLGAAMHAAMFASDSGFLDSLSTYILKVGIENLPGSFSSPSDRTFAAWPHFVLFRLRMQQIAKFLAGALVEPLAARAGAPLHLLNIAGGAACDSINALILLKHAHPDLLRRPIVIDVFDMQADGPLFGANVLAALMRPGAPLTGLAIEFRQHAYDWNMPAALTSLLAAKQPAHAIVAASSEGGLFEYGSDDAIVGNLKALHDGGAGIVSGSVTGKGMIGQTKFTMVPRGLEGFAPLATLGGYDIVKSETISLSEQILLRPNA
jgi:hypothetical protein